MTQRINKETLDNLKELMGDAFPMIITKFIETSTALISEMESALRNNEMAVVNRHAHSLKSASAQMGAETLSGFCLRLEHEKDKEVAGKLLIMIREEFFQTEELIKL